MLELLEVVLLDVVLLDVVLLEVVLVLEVDEVQLEVEELLDVQVEELVDDVQLVDVDDLLSYPGH